MLPGASASSLGDEDARVVSVKKSHEENMSMVATVVADDDDDARMLDTSPKITLHSHDIPLQYLQARKSSTCSKFLKSAILIKVAKLVNNH